MVGVLLLSSGRVALGVLTFSEGVYVEGISQPWHSLAPRAKVLGLLGSKYIAG
jgi:hypothetical protein